LREGIAKFTTPDTKISTLRVEARAALGEVLERSGKTTEAQALLQAAHAESDAAHGTLPGDVQQLLLRAASTINPAKS
jgi:hypothetical protein